MVRQFRLGRHCRIYGTNRSNAKRNQAPKATGAWSRIRRSLGRSYVQRWSSGEGHRESPNNASQAIQNTLFKSSGDGQIRSASPKDTFQTDGFVTYENCSDRLRWQMRVLQFMSRDSSIPVEDLPDDAAIALKARVLPGGVTPRGLGLGLKFHLISESRASWRGFDPAKICPFGGN
jgi:hypothetical protein